MWYSKVTPKVTPHIAFVDIGGYIAAAYVQPPAVEADSSQDTKEICHKYNFAVALLTLFSLYLRSPTFKCVDCEKSW